MRWAEMFHKDFYNSGNFEPSGVNVKITEIEVVDVVGDGNVKDCKPVMRIHGHDKGIVVNRTACDVLAELFGEDADSCIGKIVNVYRGRTMYKGKMVDSVMVRAAVETAGRRHASDQADAYPPDLLTEDGPF